MKTAAQRLERDLDRFFAVFEIEGDESELDRLSESIYSLFRDVWDGERFNALAPQHRERMRKKLKRVAYIEKSRAERARRSSDSIAHASSWLAQNLPDGMTLEEWVDQVKHDPGDGPTYSDVMKHVTALVRNMERLERREGER